MSAMTLEEAIAEVKRVTLTTAPWEAGDIGLGSSPVDYHIATILNAAASGDLIPKADAEQAVALVVKQAGDVAVKFWEGEPEDTIELRAAILFLAPADALAELARLRSKVEAADKLAEVTKAVTAGLEDFGIGNGKTCRVLRAALTAYEGAGK